MTLWQHINDPNRSYFPYDEEVPDDAEPLAILALIDCIKDATFAVVSLIQVEDRNGTLLRQANKIEYYDSENNKCEFAVILPFNVYHLDPDDPNHDELIIPLHPASGVPPHQAPAPAAIDDSMVDAFSIALNGRTIINISGFAPVSADDFLNNILTVSDPDAVYRSIVDLVDDATVFFGSASDDRIEVGAGNDSAAAGAGDDILYKWRPGDLTYDGGDGVDTLSFEPEFGLVPTPPAGAVVNLATGTGTNPFGGTLILSHIENVGGTANNDSLTGDDGDNFLSSGFSGADTIHGGGGNDTVSLGGNTQGADIDGGPGTDLLLFSAEGPAQTTILDLLNPGINTGAFQGATIAGFEAYRATAFLNFYALDFRGSNEGESAFGTLGNDHLQGRGGNDTLTGINGNDTFDGGDGLDTADYAISSFPVSVDLAAGTATGTDNGTDTLISIERVVGTRANDTFHGGLGTDSLDGGPSGIDTVVFTGTMAAHTITSGHGVVTVSGADGTHILTGIDKLQFADQTVETPLFVTIAPGAKAEGDSGTGDLLFAINLSRPSSGPVTVHVATADGTALAGSDYTAGDVEITIPGGSAIASFPVAILSDTAAEPDESFSVTLSGPVGAMLGATIAATGTIIDNDRPDSLIGTAADDAINSAGGPDTLFGMSGDDVLQGDAGDDILIGGDGDDVISGGSGNDIITGDLGFGPGNDSIDAGAGNDTVLVQDGADTVLGGDGDDVVGIFSGDGLFVDGGAGSDVLIGGFDIFGAANATLEGGAGADLLVGGRFNDTFVYESGFGPSDLIYLFTPGTDKIQLAPNVNGTGITTPNDALAHASATTLNGIGPAVAITLGAEIIYVVGLQTLQASDFLIA